MPAKMKIDSTLLRRRTDDDLMKTFCFEDHENGSP
jgi:hypothetical protein